MDWIEYLLLFVFFVLPLLQGLLGGKKKTPTSGPLPDEAERQEEVAEARAREDRLPAPEGAESWSAGWGSWPEPAELERVAEIEVMDEEEALELTALQERLRPEDASEAVRVTTPVVSLESLEVDRAGEHKRFHHRVDAALPVPGGAAGPRVATLLRGREQLRRAVLLAEVLGPPRGLR